MTDKIKLPTHNCSVFGKDTAVPRAFNTAQPEKVYFKCPMCDYTIESVTEKKDK